MAVPGETPGDEAPLQPLKRPRTDGSEGPEPGAAPTPPAEPLPERAPGDSNCKEAKAVPGTDAGQPAKADARGPEEAGKGQPAGGDAAGQGEPPPYAGGGYVPAGGGWFAHPGGEWLYSEGEKAYFHLPTGQLRLAVEGGTVPLAPGPEEGAGAEGPLQGQVRWFNPAKGFGFIEPLGEEGPDVFVHGNQLVGIDGGEPPKRLKAGTPVVYALGETDDGRMCAVNVRVVDARSRTAGGEKKRKHEEDGEAKHDEDRQDGDESVEGEEGEEGDEGEDDSSGSSVDIDLFEELKCGVHQVKGDRKDQCEDFFVDKTKIPVSVLGETATCVFFGVFDGHGGSTCSEYAAAHLAKNVLSRLRDRTKTANDETALRTALLGGFKQTEHNFLQHARRSGDASGSTACTMTVFGPDEEMRLRLFVANAGDSRAVLGTASGKVIRLTEDHKPNLPAEKKFIESGGGSVAEIAGVWRCILPVKRRLSGTIGLAVSRGFGDKDFKGPNIVNPDPEITVHEVDWDDDECVILATDGVWDVVSDKVAVRLVQRSLRQFGNEEKAAEELVRMARGRGSKDDCTALVVRFGWLKAKEGGDAAAADKSDDEDEGEVGEEAQGRHEGEVSGDSDAVGGGGAPHDEMEQEGEEEEDDDDDDDDEDGDEEEPEQQKGPGAQPRKSEVTAGAARPAVPGGDDSDDEEDDNIFAGVEAMMKETEAAKSRVEALRQFKDPATADGSGLFDNLTPTTVAGPALPPEAVAGPAPPPGPGAGEATEAPEPAPPAADDLDMFGA